MGAGPPAARRGRTRSICVGSTLVTLLCVALGAAKAASAVPREQADFFETKVRPVLVESCVGCHGEKKQASGLRLDRRSALLEGGAHGPTVAPGDPERSLLIQAVRRTHEEIKMPPKGNLPPAKVEALAAWVEMGLPWPGDAPLKSPDGNAAPHWAFQPVRPATCPGVENADWVRTPVDRFVLERLEKARLSPSPEADRRTLIRRVTFDLTGLPPTPEEVEAFVNDPAPGAYERVIERLLASPRYGERWGRHWLDVARYADTKGYLFREERRYPYSYTYRDYVIRAFNEDKPYDTFLVEQIAADRLDRPQDPRVLAAMGFLTVGRRFRHNEPDIIDDRIDVVCRGLLGLTVACARCHDHKFDAIPTDDYYSLYGVFASSFEPDDLPALPKSATAAQECDYHGQRAALEKALDDHLAAKLAEIRAGFRGRAGLYLRTAAALNFDPRHRQLEEQAHAEKLGAERLQWEVERWRATLDATRADDDPVFAPWHALAGIPSSEFSEKAPGVVAALAATGDPKAVNPVVARSLAGDCPVAMADVAACYGRMFDAAEAHWREAEKAGAKALPDPAWEQVRQAICAEKRPADVPASDLRRLLDRAEEEEIRALNDRVVALTATHSGAPPRAMVLNDRPSPVEPHVFLRGNPGRRGKAVPRRFLAVLSGPERLPFQVGSGRLELARAIADRDNPLTGRVLVNRVWLHHFGTGLVTTPSDFGMRGEPPTHPELLDWLADDFVRQGWSIKALHRRIMFSSTYRQQSVPRSEGLALDSENRLYWRFNRRRLEFEELRDAILALSGSLEPVMGGLPVAITEPPFPARRTVYGFIDRQNMAGLYRTFDFATPDATSPRRFVTTVPQQALFLMNSPTVLADAQRLAGSVSGLGTPEARVNALYSRLFGRAPTRHERALGRAFLERHADAGPSPAGLSPLERYAHALLMTNDFMFID